MIQPHPRLPRRRRNTKCSAETTAESNYGRTILRRQRVRHTKPALLKAGGRKHYITNPTDAIWSRYETL